MNHEDRKKLEEFQEILMEHGERLARIEEKTKTIFVSINEIKEILMGNGQEGLVRTVTRHKVYFALLGAAISVLIGILVKILL